MNEPEPAEVTWSDDGIEVIYAVDADYVDTRSARRAYERGGGEREVR